MKYLLKNIRWDTEGKRVKGLPKHMIIDDEEDEEDEEDSEGEQFAIDRASDEIGWLIWSCNVERLPLNNKGELL